MPDDDDHPHAITPLAITLPVDEWSFVMSGLIRAYQDDRLPLVERNHYRRIGRAVADQCPKDSMAWWGGAVFGA